MSKGELAANRRRWDELVAIHAQSRYYDLEGFRQGRSTLLPVEKGEVGDVSGRRLLHLQCHFGLDTLSWARLGAEVTGVDFSGEAISLARKISKETGIDARFVESDVYDLPSRLEGSFDIVFTSYGVLCWLPDLGWWAKVVAHFLERGGFLYIVEDHPLASVADERSVGAMRISQSYFSEGASTRYKVEGTYTDRKAKVENSTTFEWTHPLSEIINSVLDAGLRIGYIHEFPYGFFPRFPEMERHSDGTYHFRDERAGFPLLFSLKAFKE